MTTPPHQPGPYGQPNQEPWGPQSGGGYGQYGQPRPPEQPQYGGQWGNDQTQQLGPQPPLPPPGQQQYGGQYGQTPQYGATQQFGQQPQYGQFGGGFPPEPPRRQTGKIIAIVVVALLVLGGAGFGIYLATKGDDNNTAGGGTTTSSTPDKTSTSDEETTTEEDTTTADPGGGDAVDAQPGDCIKVNVASSTDADIETVDCSTPEAIYKVATREETSTGDCPNDQYVSYTEEGTLLLCLQLNVKEGDCLEVSDSEDKRAECTAPTATHRVVGVFDGVDDETKCGDEATEVITYPQPPLTICLVAPAS
ncbi:LppU/SCO3897 family protein [Actinophytocola oryzae]|uniref:Uncharacterized protein n=1 Tax=Actinophytocola oryzae TaxID=502181 RepID=A0A4V3FR21_9PSEU|nr:hypothetical protein [Actinophytocola oryzae]TDV41861.1 hypothetical protein CLV71_119183 [Actinophytocola oryzae]